MSYHDSSRARAYKEERAKRKYTVGSSGTSATARARDARRDAALAEMGITTTTAQDVAKATKKSGSGYVPTYGPNSLYTSAGNTGQSAQSYAAGTSGNTGRTFYGGRTRTGPKTNYTGGAGRRSGGAKIYESTGTVPYRSGMSDYDIQVRQDYYNKEAEIINTKNVGTAGSVSVPAGQPEYGTAAATPAADPAGTQNTAGGRKYYSGMSEDDIRMRQEYYDRQYDNTKKADYLDAMGQQTTADSFSFTPPEDPVYKRYQEAEDAFTTAENTMWDKLHEVEDYDAAYTANHSVSDLLYLEKTKAEFNDLYKTYTNAKDQYEQFYSADGGASVIESLDVELSKIAEELGEKRYLLSILWQDNRQSDQAANLSAEIEALEQEQQKYKAMRSEITDKYYFRENEMQFGKMADDAHMQALYDYATGLEADIELLTSQHDPNSTQSQEDLAYLRNKYGLGERVYGDELYRELTEKVNQAAEVLGQNGYNYERMTDYKQMLKDKEAAEKKVEEWKTFAEEHPVQATIDSILVSPMRGIDYLSTMFSGIGTSDRNDYQNYVPMNTYNMNTTNYVNTVRGTVSDNIDSKIGKFLYQAGVSAADSAVMLGASAVTGLPALAAMGMGMSAASDQAKDIIERGGTNRQAFWGGLAAGVAEAVCEKVPLDNLLNVKSADDVKGLLTNVFKQQVIEGGEEMLTEVANMISDAVIMKDNSKFNNRVDTYMAGGMSEQEAKQKATMDAISDVALAGAGGFVAGGMLGGAVNVGKYSYSGAMQGAGNRSGTNVPVIGKYTANNQGAAGAVTSGNSNTQVQQGVSQTAGGAAVFNSGIASNTGTQTSNNGNRPAAVTGNGAMQTGTTANAQTPTAVQHQMQAQTDTQNGKTIKAEGKVSELLQEAMAQPADSPARQLAEQLLVQQETALIEQGLELGSQYQLSHAEQAQLAAETANNALSEQAIGELSRLVEQEKLTARSKSMYNGEVSLPTNDSQLKHILRDDEGHLPDTPENRALLVALANDNTKFLGVDQVGTAWNAEILSDGTQNWVRHRNGIIINGGKNVTPRSWDDQTGFNTRPTQWRKQK